MYEKMISEVAAPEAVPLKRKYKQQWLPTITITPVVATIFNIIMMLILLLLLLLLTLSLIEVLFMLGLFLKTFPEHRARPHPVAAPQLRHADNSTTISSQDDDLCTQQLIDAAILGGKQVQEHRQEPASSTA